MRDQAGYEDISSQSLVIDTHAGQSLRLVGLDDPIAGNPRYDAARMHMDQDAFNIVAVHTLDGLTSDVPSHAHLVLSGHVHAGEANVGFYSGFDWLRRLKVFINLNGQTDSLALLAGGTISYISPGLYSPFQGSRFFSWATRFRTEETGVSILTLREPSRFQDGNGWLEQAFADIFVPPRQRHPFYSRWRQAKRTALPLGKIIQMIDQ